MELISKEELRDKMYHEAFEVDNEMQKWDSGCWIRYKLFEKILDEMPIIESRPKGVWVEGDRYSNHVCSICGEEAEDLQACGCCELLSDFCPHCGADMRGEE